MSLFDNVKVGDQLRDKLTGRIITITEVGDDYLSYECEPYTIKLGQYNYGTCKGGSIQLGDPIIKAVNEAYYEEVKPCQQKLV